MSLWDNMTQREGQALANELALCRPSVGKTALVVKGKKHKGKVGTIVWHGVDSYSHAGRYGDSFTNAIREVMGRYGYRIRIATESGEKFFIDADAVIVSVD